MCFLRPKGKVYDSEEDEAKRRAVFMDNIKVIEQHNWLYFNMKKSYYLGVNQFTDLVSGSLELGSFDLSLVSKNKTILPNNLPPKLTTPPPPSPIPVTS